MRRSFTRATMTAAVLLGIVVGTVRSFALIPSDARHAGLTDLRRAAIRSLPASIATLEMAADSRLTAVVAADIDADGDLDVVASDSALQLHVWVNDGAGHFTRRDPVQSTTWRPVPAAPAVDDRPASFESFTQSNPPSVSADSRLIAWTLGAPAPPLAGPITAASAADRSTRTPRAPPAAASRI